MQKFAKNMLIVLVICLCFTACGRNLVADVPDTYPALQEGDSMRDFTATLVDGSTFTLSDHKGKVILLNFWATWCGPCVGEMPAFPRLVEQFGDDLVLIAVNCNESKQIVSKFLLDNSYTFPVALDPDDAVSDLYPTDGIPYTVLFDKDGNAAHITIGAQDAETMYNYYHGLIEELLG